MRSLAPSIFAAVLVFAASSSARADTPRLVLDRLRPSAPGDAFLTVDGAAVGNGFGAAILASYARAPLVVADGSRRRVLVREQLVVHVGASLALRERVVFDVDAPVTVVASGTSAIVGGHTTPTPRDGAFGDLRLGVRLALLAQDGRVPGAALAFRVFAPTGDGAFTSTGSARYAPALIVGARSSRWLWSASVGATLVGAAGTIAGLSGGEIDAAGAAALALGPLAVGPEITASTRAGSAIARAAIAGEALVTARYRRGDWELRAGFGPGLGGAIGTPEYRVLAGLTFTPTFDSPVRAVTSTAPEEATIAARANDRREATAPTTPTQPLVLAPPPIDTDGDGIPDADDACPDAPGPITIDPKTSGCPVIARLEGEQIVIAEQVLFRNGAAVIDPASFPLLAQIGAILAAHPEIARLAVDGHTDAHGSAAKNTALSQKRAVAVVRWLADHGVDARRLETRAFGPRRPIADNRTEAGRAKNRRVEFQVRKRTTLGEAGWSDGPVD